MKKLSLFLIIFAFAFLGSLWAEEKKEFSLSIEDVSKLALENNFEIQLAKYDAYIKKNDLFSAESVFDTLISGKAAYSDNQLKPASTIAGTKSLTNEYELSLKKKLPSGTTIETAIREERKWTNSAFTTTNPSHDIKAELGLTQELGKNFFGLIDRGAVKITKIDIENSNYTSLGRIEDALSGVQKAYWLAVLKHEELKIEKEILQKAEALLALHTGKERLGLSEAPQILASGANLKQRESEVRLSENAARVAMNDLFYRLSLEPDRAEIKAKDTLDFGLMPAPSYIDSLNRAISVRRDYKYEKNNAESQKINLSLKKNSLWPQINLKLTFARNGLDKEYKEALEGIRDEDNPEYYAGLEFSFNLENNFAKGEFNKAKLEKIKQILKLKDLERKIVIEIKDALDTLAALVEAKKYAGEIVGLQEEKLKAEERRFNSGRSDTDTIISYQEDLLAARLAYARACYEVRAAEINLQARENSLLDKYWNEKL